MRIIVLRHGESEADLLNVYDGRGNFSLTELGRKQAKEAAQMIKERYNIEKIYASPLLRSRQTVEIVHDIIPVEVEFLDDLMEFDTGLLSGMPKAFANKQYPPDPTLPLDKARYGMESIQHFYDRAKRAINHIIEHTGDVGTILVVTHGALISRMYQAFLHKPISSRSNYVTHPGHFHEWAIHLGKRMISSSDNGPEEESKGE